MQLNPDPNNFDKVNMEGFAEKLGLGPLFNIWQFTLLAYTILYYKIQSVCLIVCSCGIGSQTMRTTVMNLLQVTQWV